jgi:DnaK suppressor protein
MITEKLLLAQPKNNYMDEGQLAFFVEKLTTLREEIKFHTTITMKEISDQEREIEKALTMIKNRSYGYCIETGDPIGLPRLLIRPTATLCAEEKNRREHIEKGYRK